MGLKLEQGFFTWTKGTREQLSAHFRTTEMECDCALATCSQQRVERALIDKLEALREAHGAPIVITSGYRCQEHQDNLTKLGFQTAKKSQHLFGRAVDIKAADMKALKALVPKFFKAIGWANTFVHVDMRDDKTRRWKYV